MNWAILIEACTFYGIALLLVFTVPGDILIPLFLLGLLLLVALVALAFAGSWLGSWRAAFSRARQARARIAFRRSRGYE